MSYFTLILFRQFPPEEIIKLMLANQPPQHKLSSTLPPHPISSAELQKPKESLGQPAFSRPAISPVVSANGPVINGQPINGLKRHQNSYVSDSGILNYSSCCCLHCFALFWLYCYLPSQTDSVFMKTASGE